MEYFEITGGRRLKGKTNIFGSKNVALKVMVAACLSEIECVIENQTELIQSV